MGLLKLIKYPGSKNALIPHINNIYRKSGCDIFVDVFGGSGTVLLNTPTHQSVFNDLNEEITNLFKSIKTNPEEFYDLIQKFTSTRRAFREYGRSSRSIYSPKLTGWESAFLTFYRFNTGFGGMGSTYQTTKEKASYSFVKKVEANFKLISGKVSGWTIENLDFRLLFRKYDREDVFFYFDPPYQGKKWYEFGFELRDVMDLKQIFSEMKGKYVLNVDYSDLTYRELLGDPDFIVSNLNQNRLKASTPQFRNYSFYSNI